MTPEQKDQLEKERTDGKAAAKYYKSYIKEFCQSKRESLFMSFSELGISETEKLMEVKRMLFAIDTLDAEIISVIKTGEMASMTLEAQKEEDS